MNKKRLPKTTFFVSVFLWALFVSFTVSPSPHCLADTQHNLVTKFHHGGYAFGIGEEHVHYNGNSAFIPASTIKIVTNLTALNILGQNHHFQTLFYIDQDSNLYIQGQGDPYLVSENITKIVQHLKHSGIQTINNLILDSSNFQLEVDALGSNHTSNPYDAVNGALCVNFNAIPIKVTKGGIISSGEPQTPFLPLMQEIGKDLTPGFHRLNVSAYQKKNDRNFTIRYTAELFLALLEKEGIQTENTYFEGQIPQSARLFYTYTSDQSLIDLVRMNLKYSNNYIANQIFLACGIKTYGLPATWRKGQKSITEFIKRTTGLTDKEFLMVEGSGLSRKNRITPLAMLLLLKNFQPYSHLLPQKNGHFLKTGTLSGVYNYAGFFHTNSNLIPIVLFLNGQENNRDHLLNLLFKEYQKQSTKISHK